MKTLIATLSLVLCGASAFAQKDVADFSAPPTDSWPTYHGDYSGRHFSPLTQITPANVHGLSLAWMYRTNGNSQGAILGGQAPVAVPGRPTTGPRGVSIKSIPLMKDGVLYLSSVNNVFALDARSGQERWHYLWQGKSAIGNRGLGMRGNSLFFETADNHVVALDATTGKELWSKPLAANDATNFSTSAPTVVRNHVLIGVGGDSGYNGGWVESHNAETGELEWKWNVTPRAGEPGVETWPTPQAAALGAGAPWQPFTYDPQLNLVYVSTGNPTPTYNGHAREGDNLYTCSIVALNPDTGKMVWYYQVSPHETHDWDSTEVPVLIDANYEGKPRKMLAMAARNGYFFLLDRMNGKMLKVKPFIANVNGYKGVGPNGQLIPNLDVQPSPGGSLAAPDSDGATNYPAPTFSPKTGLFYVNTTTTASIFYLPKDPKDPSGYVSRGIEHHTALFDSALLAMDYATGEIKWKHSYPEKNGFASGTYPGMLSTDTGVLFTGNPSGDFVAFDDRNGKILWHAPLGSIVSNTPETYMLDGRQYVLVASGEGLFAFYLQ